MKTKLAKLFENTGFIKEVVPIFNTAFKKWFSNSKVVDEHNQPLIVYHGSGKIFNNFDTTRGFLGTWFTNNFDNANNISKGLIGNNKNSYVYACYLKICKPKIYDKPEEINGISDTHWQFFNDLNRFKNEREYIDNLKEKGFDGIIIKNTYLDNANGSTDYIVFKPNQIKSIDNIGTWSEMSNNIHEKYQKLNGEIKKLLEDYYTPFFEESDSLTAFEIFYEFLSDKQEGIEHIQWTLIPAEQYHNALKMYMKDGASFKFPQKTLENWLNIICKNVTILNILTDVAGHSQYFPLDDFNDAFREENPVKDYYEASDILEDEGFWDWAILPDGSDAISDYGRTPIMNILMELDQFASSEEMLIAINRCLDVAHCRGDLASAFIEGGSRSCEKISNE